MSPLRIAPYIAQNIQRSYARQQRVGERIAGEKVKESAQTGPASEVEISSQARDAADIARQDAEQARTAQIEHLAQEFVHRFLIEPEPRPGTGGEKDSGESGPEVSDPKEGRTAFVRLLESYGLTIEKDESGYGEIIVHTETKDVLLQIPHDAQDTAKSELLALTRDILTHVL